MAERQGVASLSSKQTQRQGLNSLHLLTGKGSVVMTWVRSSFHVSFSHTNVLPIRGSDVPSLRDFVCVWNLTFAKELTFHIGLSQETTQFFTHRHVWELQSYTKHLIAFKALLLESLGLNVVFFCGCSSDKLPKGHPFWGVKIPWLLLAWAILTWRRHCLILECFSCLLLNITKIVWIN